MVATISSSISHPSITHGTFNQNPTHPYFHLSATPTHLEAYTMDDKVS